MHENIDGFIHSFQRPQGSKLGSLLGHNRGSDPAAGLEELSLGEEMDVLIKWDGLSYCSPWPWGDSDAGGDSLSGQGRLHRGGDFSNQP